MGKVTDIWGKKSKQSKPVSCWASHPPYLISDDEGCHEIIGGSCTSSYPDVDVYIALDGGGCKGKRSYPWHEGVDIYFKIKDMGVPEDLDEFKNLLSYTAKAMRAGKSVFVGCIGGHGRTGLFLAALTKFMTGEKDAIKKVRKEYCKKAVESQKQIDWLNKHFKITKAEPTKKSFSAWSSKGSTQKNFTDAWGSETGEEVAVEGPVTEGKPQLYMPVDGHCILAKKV